MIQLPIDSFAPSYQVATEILGVTYLFDVRWNSRAESWFVSIADENEDPIVSGIRLTLDAPLGRRCQDPRFPAGRIFASDLSGGGREATLDDLGTRVIVYFGTFAELAA